MKARSLLNLSMTLIAIALSSRAIAQPFTCGQQTATAVLMARDPAFQQKSARIEADWRNHLKRKQLETANPRQPASPTPGGGSVITLPVVVHIIHDNGPENISDAQVQTAIQHLNEAYANIGYYHTDGVDIHVQFCLAQRDPSNQPTTGITRDVSPYTNIGAATWQQDELSLKNLNRWDPFSYINIWVIRSIPGTVAGFAYLPPMHGSNVDGIVLEARYFGVTEAYDVLVIHEMGHVLGLYHTFEGGCTNNDCSLDGDRVCDTPPDNSTASIPCNQTMNSCTTDTLSGFTTDQNDLTKDYMDYGNVTCMTIFTQGQADRMNWSIQNVLYSLLASKACLPPCPSPVTAAFAINPGPLTPGATIQFTNQSVNATGYTWYVNGAQQSNSTDLSHTFPGAGFYTIRLLATSGNPLCDVAEKDTILHVLCPATAVFTPADTSVLIGAKVHYSYTGANATAWQWWLDGTKVATGAVYDVSFPKAGDHSIRLVSTNGQCSSEVTGHLKIVDPADSCSIHTFQKSMPFFSIQEAAIDAQGNYLLSGISSAADVRKPLAGVMKLDPAGTPLWAETIAETRNSLFTGGRFLPDGGSIHSGATREANGTYSLTLTRLDAGGNLLWAKKYTDPSDKYPLVSRLTPLSGGGFAVAATTGGIIRPMRVIRTDDNGNLLWAKGLLDGTLPSNFWLIEDNGQLIFSIQAIDITVINNRAMLFSLDPATGNYNWAKFYVIPGAQTWSGQVHPWQGNYISSFSSDKNQYGALLVDPLGNPLSGLLIQDAQTTVNLIVSDIAVAPDRSLLLSASEYAGNTVQNAALVKISAAGNLVGARIYPMTPARTFVSVQPTPDKGFLALGTTIGSARPTMSILKTDSALRLFTRDGGSPSCSVVKFTPSVQSVTVSTIPFTSPILDIPVTVTPYQPGLTPFAPPLVNYCEDPVGCSLLTILGKDTACGARDSLTFTARRNADCSGKVAWTLDDTTTTLSQPTDSTVSLHFSTPGKRLLHASLSAGCHILTDSAWLVVPASADTVDLGPDITLCTASTIRLSAGPGFRSYLWKNGSEDSTQTVWLPGTYWVVATDFCNVPHSDTITISATLPPDFNLGPDGVICGGDSLKLSAPSGFDTYHWSPDYRLGDATARVVYASPMIDTVYTCTATKGAGCSVTDSIRIKVNLCHKGLYFPGAFTPNKDGANDLYRPVIIGAWPLEYYLAIYNREGQLVFETRDPSAGWDGRVRGIPSVSNTFVWFARYRLPGEPERLDKGMLVLVH